MIRKLRLKFVLVTTGVMVIVFTVLFLGLNIFMQTSSINQTEQLLKVIADADGKIIPFVEMGPPDSFPDSALPLGSKKPDMLRAGRYFFAKVDHENVLLEINFEMMFDFSFEDAHDYVMQVLESNQQRGTISNLQYLMQEKDYGKIIVFSEQSIVTQLLTRLSQASLWVAGATFLVILLLSIVLSKWAVKPVEAAFLKQRRFISDASHELKTPLTTISVNADVLQSEIGENAQLKHIKSQTERMSLLVKDLLTLARTDEGLSDLKPARFNLSEAVQSTVLEFEALAFEAQKQYRYEIAENIYYLGNEPQMKQLTSILVDNAIRHSNQNGEILVQLSEAGGKICLSVYNTGVGLSELEQKKVFDRFYRSDSSRSRDTGGFGLGLSIANAIVSAHKGKIQVDGQPQKWVKFTVQL